MAKGGGMIPQGSDQPAGPPKRDGIVAPRQPPPAATDDGGLRGQMATLLAQQQQRSTGGGSYGGFDSGDRGFSGSPLYKFLYGMPSQGVSTNRYGMPSQGVSTNRYGRP